MNATPKLDRFVASLATVHDEELVNAARSAEAHALLSDIVDTRLPAPRPRPRRVPRRVIVGASGLAVAAAAAILALSIGGGGTGEASAAIVLKHAAHVAARQQQLVPGPGQYLYTKSIDAYLVDNPSSYSYVVPHVREVWLGPDGAGRLHETNGAPVFLTDRDRQAWIAQGRPSLLSGGPTDMSLGPQKPLDLPSDPDALYAQLRQETESYGRRQDAEMFVLVGDSLRETAATPAQKAALYAVAARIPGVQLLGTVTDPEGRQGTAVALDDPVNRLRSVLVLDPSTGTLLDEEEYVLSKNSFGFGEGTRIGWASYIKQAVVDSDRARP